MVDILELSETVRVSQVYADTQTQGIGHGEHPWIVRDGPGISGVRGYSDTGSWSWWTSSDCPGRSGYLRCTQILRHRELVMVDILGLSGMVQVSQVYTDTQTQGVGHGGHPWIVLDGPGITGVCGYSYTESWSWWTSSDCPGWSRYLRCTQILRHRGLVMVDILGLSWTVQVSQVYADTHTQAVGHGGHPRIVWYGLGITGVCRYSHAGDWSWWISLDCPGWSGYPRCTRILRLWRLVILDILGLSEIVWVTLVYADLNSGGWSWWTS